MASNRNESEQIARLFGFTFCVAASYLICRTVADAVLLTRLGPTALPPLIFAAAVSTGIVSVWWVRRTMRLSLLKVVKRTQLASGLLTGVLLILLRVFPDSSPVIGGLFLLAELRGCFNTIQVTLLLNAAGRGKDDKRTFSFVNAGAAIAGISMGLIVGAQASQFASSTLLVGACVLDLVGWLIVRGVRAETTRRMRPTRLPSHVPPNVVVTKVEPTADGKRSPQSAPLGSAIMWLVVCKIAVLTIISYEWKVFAVQAFPHAEHTLTAFFAFFYAITDALTVGVQLLLAPRLLRRTGIAISLFILPIYLLIFGVASLIATDITIEFLLLTLARGGVVLRRGFNDVAVQLLYGWLPRLQRRQTVVRVMGIAKPITEAAVSGTIAVLASTLPTQKFAWLWIPTILLWFRCINRLIAARNAQRNTSPAANRLR